MELDQYLSVDLLREVIDHLPIGIMLWKVEDVGDPGSWRLILSNAATNEATGISWKDFAGKTLREGFPKALETNVPEIWRRAMLSGRTEQMPDLNYEDRNVSRGIYGIIAVPIGNKYLCEVLRNITVDRKIDEYVSLLENANQEIESFSYSVSHDLRAPLRAIDGFSRILSEDYGGELGEEGKHVVDTIRKNTDKMGRLIDDLLNLSRIGRKEVNKEKVNMKELAIKVFNDLRIAVPARDIELNIGEIPSANVDPILIEQVWANLISNAIKYSKIKDKVIINIGSDTKDNEVIYFVRDNGVGFDMRYVAKLFGVFQRLHDEKDFEGTGIGLSIVKKIIIKHGGRVWAEGKVNEGATFYFSVPA